MAQLLLHGAAIETVFDLLGRDENDMTYALGWGLTRSDEFLSTFVRGLGLDAVPADEVVVRLHRNHQEGHRRSRLRLHRRRG